MFYKRLFKNVKRLRIIKICITANILNNVPAY